jgi:hypothetical protein
MRALIGYVVAISVLLGGAYAGLQWLTTAPAEKPAAQAKNTPDKSARLAQTASPAGAKRNSAATPPAEPRQEARNADTATTGKSNDRDNAPQGARAGGCAPIGLTGNGDFVYSMQCQELIERHRGPIAAADGAAPNAPAPAQDQEARTAKLNDNAAPQSPSTGQDAAPGARNSTVATADPRPPAANPGSDSAAPNPSGSNSSASNSTAAGSNNAAGTNRSDSPAKPRRELARREQRAARAEPSKATATSQPQATAGRSKLVKQRQPLPPEPEIIFRDEEDREPVREQRREFIREPRPLLPERPRRLAGGAELDWFNILGWR